MGYGGSRRRRRSVFRRPILRKRKPTYNAPFPELQKVGGEKRSQGFNEDSKSVVYSWQSLTPLIKPSETLCLKPVRAVASLKSLCALELAKNVGQLELGHLDAAPWSCWKPVWKAVLKLNNDSFEVVKRFATRFRKEAQFSCHLDYGASSSPLNGMSDRDQLSVTRRNAIAATAIPGARNHRLENVFSNTNIHQFAQHIYKISFKPWILLDLSLIACDISADDHYRIINIPNIVALDLSNSSFVDDQFLSKLAQSIKNDSKLRQLTILKINRCGKVTRQGLQHLFDISDSRVSSLSYIETDVKIVPLSNFTHGFSVKRENEDCYIDNTRWKALPENDRTSKLISKLPLALKLHTLYKQYHSTIIAKDSVVENDHMSGDFRADTTTSMDFLQKSKDTLILDFVFQNEEFTPSDYEFPAGMEKLKKSWRRRVGSRNKEVNQFQYNYIANHNYLPTQKGQCNRSPPRKRKVTSPIFRATTKKRTSDSSKRANNKPRKVITDVNSFFT